MGKPLVKKRSTFYDTKITQQERLSAYQALSPSTKQALKKASYKPGQVPTIAQMDAVLNSIREQVLKDLAQACRTALQQKDIAGINTILGAMKKGDLVGIEPDAELMDKAASIMRQIARDIEVKAYTNFRKDPTSDNYARCWGAKGVLDTLGIEESTTYPVNPWPKCRVRPPNKPGPYKVVTGDWLSKIAQEYYGAANLWDAIFESNNYDGHPDRIKPGTMLKIS